MTLDLNLALAWLADNGLLAYLLASYGGGLVGVRCFVQRYWDDDWFGVTGPPLSVCAWGILSVAPFILPVWAVWKLWSYPKKG